MQRRLVLILALMVGFFALSAVTLLSVIARIDANEASLQASPVERPPMAPPNASARDSLFMQRPLGPRTKRRVLRGQILLALAKDRRSLDRCVSQRPEGFGGASVSLDVALLDGETRIEDVDIIDPGTADPSLMECARQALRGQRLSTPIAEATAQHARVVFPLGSRRLP